MKTQPAPMHVKISVRVNDKQYQTVLKAAKKHKMNVEVMLANPIAIHDHTDIMTAIELELAQIAEYEDKLEAITKHFPI